MPKIAGAQAALIVYDVTNMRSFDNVQDWLQVVKRVTKNEEKVRDSSGLDLTQYGKLEMLSLLTQFPPITISFVVW